MSLRMNLYGFNLSLLVAVVGSNDSTVAERATAQLEEILPNEPEHSRAKAWIRKLIEKGCPFRWERERTAEPSDGELVTVSMEAEFHVFALFSILRAIAREDDLDLASESSTWHHSAVAALYDDATSCGFALSKECDAAFHSWMSKLSNGSPLFGDDFRTQWSFYTVFSNQDLVAMIPVLKAAAEFKRTLPEEVPQELLSTLPTSLSQSGQKFNLELTDWFGQIQYAGQDAFILWW